MRRRALASVFVGALLLGACASLSVDDRIAQADDIAARHGFAKLEIETRHFPLRAFVGPQRRGGVLHIYIEGDGFAWVTRNKPSQNPTPRDPVALKLAVLDPHDAAYLARPCQYVALERGSCQPRDWASARFSSEAIAAMDEAINQLKHQMGAAGVVLIGYSGGGAVAALVAARRADVAHLVTVAGNLDPVAWARWHSVPELSGSLNPRDVAARLANIRQTHFVGERDRIVPFDIYRSYRAAFPHDADISATLVPRADHACCWEQVWPALLRALD